MIIYIMNLKFLKIKNIIIGYKMPAKMKYAPPPTFSPPKLKKVKITYTKPKPMTEREKKRLLKRKIR